METITHPTDLTFKEFVTNDKLFAKIN